MEHIDIVFKTEAKRRSSVKRDATRWNSSKRIIEYWNGTEWVDPYEEIISGSTSVDLNKHKADPNGHPLVTTSTPGFASPADKKKLDSITGPDSLGLLTIDPVEVFKTALG